MTSSANIVNKKNPEGGGKIPAAPYAHPHHSRTSDCFRATPFAKACEALKIQPTTRQANAWLRGFGKLAEQYFELSSRKAMLSDDEKELFQTILAVPFRPSLPSVEFPSMVKTKKQGLELVAA